MLKPETIPSSLGIRRGQMGKTNAHPPTKALPHPAAFAPRIFADTATLEEIKPLKEGGLINGVTTNPSLLKRAGATSMQHAIALMHEIVRYMAPYPVSLELTHLEPRAMLTEAENLAKLGENVVIKVPVGGYPAVDKRLDPFSGLKVLRVLWEKNIKTNATLIFNTSQAFWAANAGATYVSPFLGRMADYLYAHDHPERPAGNALHFVENHKIPAGGADRVYNTAYVAQGGERKDAGVRLIQEIVGVFSNYQIHTEVLAASFRHAAQVSECLLAGADILTVPATILAGVADHPLSDEGMQAFVADARTFAH